VLWLQVKKGRVQTNKRCIDVSQMVYPLLGSSPLESPTELSSPSVGQLHKASDGPLQWNSVSTIRSQIKQLEVKGTSLSLKGVRGANERSKFEFLWSVFVHYPIVMLRHWYRRLFEMELVQILGLSWTCLVFLQKGLCSNIGSCSMLMDSHSLT